MATKSIPIPIPTPTTFLLSTTSQTTPSLPRFHLRAAPSSSLRITRSRSHLPNCQNPSPHVHPTPEKPESSELYGGDDDTQVAISSFLQGNGLPKEEADGIASGCPHYAGMLVDGVRDLEEWNGWTSGGGGGGGGEREMGFKEKVVYLAKEKGDGGKVAFFESFGLSLRSSMNVARYLSKESLTDIFLKVKHMKEFFFSASDDKEALRSDPKKEAIGEDARRMMMHLSIATDDDLQQTLSFFEKIAARDGGLDMLGSSDASLVYMVESFPLILLLTVDSHLMPMIEYLESVGVPKQYITRIFLLYPPVMLSGIRGLKQKIESFQKVGSFDRSLGRMIQKYPWILSACIQANYQTILSYFLLQEVPKEKVEKAIMKYPSLLGCSSRKLQVMVDELGRLGVKDQKLGKAIAASPKLLLMKPQDFLKVVSFLEGIGFDRKNIMLILARCPELFAVDIEKTLKEKLEFLTRLGISKAEVPRAIKKYPELLVYDVNTTLPSRVNYLMEIGLTQREVANMISRFSPLLGYSVDGVLRPKYEFLVNTMKRPITDLASYPRYFSCSLEKRIRPRFGWLRSRNVECSLKEMLAINDEEFAAKFMDDKRMPLPPHM